MKFRQVDQIVSLVPGQEIVARRTLRADEDYLEDHFPRFPVMPGVMMLESLHQAAMWMIRTGDDFSHPLVLLKEVRSVKFGDFLAPGETLEIAAKAVQHDALRTSVKASAGKSGRTTVSARLVLERTHLDDPRAADYVRHKVRQQFQELFGTELLGSVIASDQGPVDPGIA
ncbi:MAG: beta-hydroxyacyl-ACP dehydratase [Planctomycetota bacterium]